MTRKIIKFNSLKSSLKHEFNRQYPFGFKDAIIEINKSNDKETMYAVPLEIDDTYYMVIVENKLKKLSKKQKSLRNFWDNEDFSEDYEGATDFYNGQNDEDDNNYAY